jgi:hypothetical protein
MTYDVIPPNNNRSEYVTSAIEILNQGKSNITTTKDGIPIDWGLEIQKTATALGYNVRFDKVPVNFGEIGTAFAIFYFERIS